MANKNTTIDKRSAELLLAWNRSGALGNALYHLHAAWDHLGTQDLGLSVHAQRLAVACQGSEVFEELEKVAAKIGLPVHQVNSNGARVGTELRAWLSKGAA